MKRPLLGCALAAGFVMGCGGAGSSGPSTLSPEKAKEINEQATKSMGGQMGDVVKGAPAGVVPQGGDMNKEMQKFMPKGVTGAPGGQAPAAPPK